MRIDELLPEQARWVILPVFAWTAIETKANAGLAHLNAQDPDFVGGYELAELMDATLGPTWRRAPVRNGLVRRNLLEALKHEIEIGRWVVLRWTRQPLVEWIEDSHAPDGGRWQLNHRGRTSSLGSALQSRLNRAYREQEALRARAKALSLVPLGQLAAKQTERTARARAVSAKPMTLTKAQRWNERQTLIAAGHADSSASANGAAERLARNNVAVEKARLAEHVYAPARAVPEGWKNGSEDLDLLKRHGFDPLDFESDGTNFRAQLYNPDRSVFGDGMKPTVAFKGTEISSWEDWGNNLSQAMNLDAPYYRRAVNLGEKMKPDTLPIDITGHSLGGGLCSAASRASGKDCWSFNAAGLHPETVAHYGGIPQPSVVHAYHVQGDILTLMQRWTPLPEAVGTPYLLSGSGSPVSRHFINQAIDGIEQQKQEDIATLQAISETMGAN
jgi:hypothetical protein